MIPFSSGMIRSGSGAPAPSAAPRLIVTTDIGEDPDDQQSMVRLMMYSNHFDIRGLIATQDSQNPGPSFVQPGIITNVINAYGQVHANLLQHDSRYPPAADLLPLVKSGAPTGTVAASVTGGAATTGSNWIIDKVDESSEITWISIWGGQVDLARALRDAQLNRGKTTQQFNDFLAKIRVFAITDQDPGLSSYIRTTWPTLWYIENGPTSGTGSSGSFERQFRGFYQNHSNTSELELVPSSQFSLVQSSWRTTHVSSGHGALGALYPTGAQPLPLTSANTVNGVKEGDTPSWFHLIPHGLNDPLQPTWGGWGGRYTQISANHWVDALDTDHPTSSDTNVRRKWPIARWRVHYQNSFQARMDRCLGSFAAVNHEPVAVLNGDTTLAPVAVTASQGATVNLSAAGSSDPDGNTLSYQWYQYKDVDGTHSGTLSITGATSQACSFTAPNTNTTIHMILMVTDNGTPNLTSYRRAIITVT